MNLAVTGLDGLWTALIAVATVLGLVGAAWKWRQITSWFGRSGGPQALSVTLTTLKAQEARNEFLEGELAKANARISSLEEKVSLLTEAVTSAGKIEDLRHEVAAYHEQVMGALKK